MEWFLFLSMYHHTHKPQNYGQINNDAPCTACQYL